MNLQFSHIHLIYLGLVIVSMLVCFSGVFILKKKLKFRGSDATGIYGSIFVIVVSVIVLLYDLLHVVGPHTGAIIGVLPVFRPL